jgi:hypothetical protein
MNKHASHAVALNAYFGTRCTPAKTMSMTADEQWTASPDDAGQTSDPLLYPFDCVRYSFKHA